MLPFLLRMRMRSDEEIYSAWAPFHGIWSPWVKPVLFAHLSEASTVDAGLDPTMEDLSFLKGFKQSTALVVDLRGARSVNVGIALTSIGFRPVPLFNAIPSPVPWASVDVRPTITALTAGAEVLISLNLPTDAAPAFLLDYNRTKGPAVVEPGYFDNRSISLPTDFPSGNFLRSRGIECVVVIQSMGFTPEADLTHTLLRWKEAGLEILAKPMDHLADLNLASLRKPMWYRSLFYRFIATLGLRRNRFGGFGGMLPMAG
jgi:hypothetical protein